MSPVVPESIFTFTDRSYVECFWFIGHAGGDWIAVLYRDNLTDAPWRVTHRFRRTVDDKVWGSADAKSVHEHTGADGSDATRRELRAAFDDVSKVTAEAFKAKRWLVVVQGDAERAMTLLSRQPWAHTRHAVPGPERPQ